MKKRRNKPITGMIAVLMILIVMLTTVVDAKRVKIEPGQAPAAEAVAASPGAQQAAAAGKPANEMYEITDGGKNYVYGSRDEIVKDTTLSDISLSNLQILANGAAIVYETEVGDFPAGAEFPSNPGYTMDKTGEFTQVSGASKLVLKPDSNGNYEIFKSGSTDQKPIRTGTRMQMRNNDGTPKTGEGAFAIQEEDIAQNTVTFRVKETTTKPMSKEMYNKLLGETGEMIEGITPGSDTTPDVIKTVSGATYTVAVGALTPPAGDKSAAGDSGPDYAKPIPKIQVTTVTKKTKDSKTVSEQKEYNFETTGIKGEVVDKNVQLTLPDGTKIDTKKPVTDFEKDIATTGITDAKIKGRSYEYTLKHDDTGKVTMKRKTDVPKQGQEQSAEDIVIDKGGVKTETRYTKKDGKVVDFERSEKRGPRGELLDSVTRSSDESGWGMLVGDLGQQEGNTLEKKFYTYDENGNVKDTYTQVSSPFTSSTDGSIMASIDQASGQFNSQQIAHFDPITNTMSLYNPDGFDQNNLKSPTTTIKDVDTGFFSADLGLGGLFSHVPSKLTGNPAAIKQYREARSKERELRIAAAKDYAATFGQMSSLFADNGAFKAWSRRTDVLFNNWIMGGSEYRVSKICESNLRKIPANVLVVQTPGGQLVTAAFVNGERQAFKNPINNSVEYLYKISYKVNIPESLIDKAEVHMRQRIRAIDDPVPAPPARILRKDPGTGQRLEEFLAEGPFFNIILFGKSGRKCLFIDSGSKKCEGESIKKGANAVQRNMFVKYSPNDYTRVCIEFTRSLEFANKKANSICADIVGVNDQPRNVVDVPETPTENPSMDADGTSPDARTGPISTTATGQITTADI